MPIVSFSIGGRTFDLSPQDVTTLISFSLNFILPKSSQGDYLKSFPSCLSISIYSRLGTELSLSALAVSRPWIFLHLVDLSGNSGPLY